MSEFGGVAAGQDESGAELIRTIVEHYDNGLVFDEATKSFPFAGTLTYSVTTTAPVVSGLTDGGAIMPDTTFKTETWNEFELKHSDAGRPFAIAVLTVTDQSQVVEGVDGLLLRNVVSRPSSAFDEYGNQLGQDAIAYDGNGVETARVRTVNEFYPRGQRNEVSSGDPTRWEVSLLRRRTVSSEGTSRTLRFEYTEETGHLAKRIRAPGEPDFEQTSEFVYDDRGNLLQARTEAGGIIKDTAFDYGSDGFRLTAVTGPSGLQARVLVDRGSGLPLTEIDPNGAAVQHIYDGFGREVRTVTPTGEVETQLVANVDPTVAYRVTRLHRDGLAAKATSADFDSKGRALRTVSTGLDGVVINQASAYTANGQLYTMDVPHPLGEESPARSIRTYDNLGSLRATATPGEAGEPPAVTRFEYATRYTVPEETLPEQEPGEPPITFIARKVDPEGNVTTTYSGPLQQVLVRVEGEGAEREVTRISYDSSGEIDKLTGAHNVMVIERDAWGRTESVADSDIGTLGYSYDPFDRLVSAVDADGSLTGYQYDVLDRLVRVSHETEEERFIFDRDWEGEAEGEAPVTNALGRLVRSVRTTPNGTFSQKFNYEAPPQNGNGLENRAMLERVVLETPEQTFDTRYEYFPGTARVAIQHYPGSAGAFAIGYCYDAQGSITHVLDALGAGTCENPEAGGSGPFWQRTSTFAGMGIDGVTLGNGVEWSAAFDPTSLRLQGHTVTGTSSSLASGYDYEAGGRLLRETRTGGSTPGSIAFDRTFGYGSAGLLSSMTDANSGESYMPTYTPGRQLHTGPSGLGTFEYEGADGASLGNRLKRVDPLPDDPDQTPHAFEYDGRGNQTRRTGPKVPGGEQSIGYNVFNLPDTITTGTGASAFSVAFDYDASGTRVHTLRPDAELWHFGGIYDKELRDNDPDLEEEHRYSVFAGGQRVAQIKRTRRAGDIEYSSEVAYLHYDRKGSVIGLSDSAGNITAELDYGVYGEPKQAMPVPWGFTGHRHEQDLGLVDAGGRFYDPVFGVFLSADPISPLGGSSPRMNRYAYVGYDPVNFVDPTGFFWEEIRDFAVQAFADTHIRPLNLLLTGRWSATWDEQTTLGLFQAVFTGAAAAACTAVGTPLLGAACVAGVSALFAKVNGGDPLDAAAMGGAGFLVGWGAGAGASAGAQAMNASRTGSALAAAAAASGANLGLQAVRGNAINWPQVSANAAFSAFLAWRQGAAADSAAEASGVGAGEAAGRAADAVAGHTRASTEDFDRRGFRGGVGNGRPQLLGYVVDSNGRVLGQLELLRYETAYRGIRIEIGFRDYGTGAQDLQVVQTVNADPVADPGWTPNPSVDSVPPSNFYPATYRDAGGYDLVFRDAPARYTTPGPVTWQAETSVVGRFDTHYQRLISVEWGWTVPTRNGPVLLGPIVVIETPTEFHVRAIP